MVKITAEQLKELQIARADTQKQVEQYLDFLNSVKKINIDFAEDVKKIRDAGNALEFLQLCENRKRSIAKARKEMKQGAVDLYACPDRPQICQCGPKCIVCGFNKHMAIHGPFYGGLPGSKPYDHQYQPSGLVQVKEGDL